MSVAIRQVTNAQNVIDLANLRTEVGMATMHQCLMMSESAWEARIDDKFACVWGLIPPTLMSDQAYLWLHTTEVADQHTFLLVRYSQLWIKEMLKTFPTLVGHCLKDAERSHRWLRWLGARFGKPDGRLVPFVIEAPNG
jgi:hypothetical protein